MGRTVKRQKNGKKVVHKYDTTKMRNFNRNKLSQVNKGMSVDDIESLFEDQEEYIGKVDVYVED